MNHSVCLALIHNNNAKRNNYIRPKIDGMVRDLSKDISVITAEISYQHDIRPHSFAMALMRDVMYRRLDRDWHRYRLLKPSLLIWDILRFAKASFIKYVIKYKSQGARWLKHSAIETIVTDKHIRAWNQFLDSGASFIICFEDDAMFLNDSSGRINKLLEQLSQFDQEKHMYVDLAGGCELEALKIDKLEENRIESFRIYSKPVTNIACAYVINRKLAGTFINHLLLLPWLRLIGIDWLMNALFIRSPGKQAVCMHADPTIFKHGTATGDYASWQATKTN